MTHINKYEKLYISIHIKQPIAEKINTMNRLFPNNYYILNCKRNSSNLFIGKLSCICINSKYVFDNIIVFDRIRKEFYNAIPNKRILSISFQNDEVFYINKNNILSN